MAQSGTCSGSRVVVGGQESFGITSRRFNRRVRAKGWSESPDLLRVKLAAGGKIPPHTHPDERVTTVLSGTLFVGFGATFDETGMVSIPTGAVYVAPAQTPHYVWAKDGAVSYQEMGIGPTGTSFIPAKSPP
ncbi:MAG: cupin domain-containing protein [Candidatus Competibacteraceae bacterium]|nr:cupin domain-containing protein [Candidatus Competibacteraceae bacterium]